MVLDLNGQKEDSKLTLTYLLKINTMQASAHSVQQSLNIHIYTQKDKIK
jgi:hypothetical protein